jgi:hypothetical protein
VIPPTAIDARGCDRPQPASTAGQLRPRVQFLENNVATLRDNLRAVLLSVCADLETLVRIPSASQLPEHAADVRRSASAVADLFAEERLEVRLVAWAGIHDLSPRELDFSRGKPDPWVGNLDFSGGKLDFWAGDLDLSAGISDFWAGNPDRGSLGS